ncbi:MAG: tRNA (5-methylaminomethyl-2-thiouridine)(34)-methyltransferase MnmD [Planctomycetes bacterium]|nr:tRNA (5-methylaminomethyl-2-thiouridine)(34)-methyltransferase MnmD [Planctomycetota bacterium]
MPELVPTDDGSWTLRDPKTGETHHSQGGALTEARHVYLELSGAAQRARHGEATRVLEVGFGCGLDFMVTWEAFASAGTRLVYEAFENALPERAVLEGLGHGALIGDARFAALLAVLYDANPVACATLDASTTLRLIRADARTVALEPNTYDVVYFDPFSPGVAPELWEPAFLGNVVQAMKPGATFTSYCVRGSVRRALKDLGLHVEKRPGPGRKREVLFARR